MTLRERFLSNIRGDIFGGVTAGVVALPLALGFGVASGLENGAAIGMYGAIAVGICAAVFGGTPSQISGPTGPMTAVVAGLAGSLMGDPSWIFVMVALAGLIQIMMGFLRVGVYINYVPYPVISGFMSGIGVIVVALQFGALLGHPPASRPLQAIMSISEYLVDINWTALILGMSTIGIIYLFPRITPAIPSTLIALFVMTGLSVLLSSEVPRIGAIPAGLPDIRIPDLDWAGLQLILPSAFVLAVVGAIDSLLTSLVADSVTGTRHDSNRELVGQGIGNVMSGLIGGLPGAGATMRTVVNIRSGGRTALSGLVHGLLLISLLVVFGPLAERIPLAVLAGILVTVGIGIVDRRGLGHLRAVPRGDAAIMLTVLGLTVFVDLIWAVAVGMVMASLVLVKRLADMDPAAQLPLMEVARHDLPPLDVPEEVLRGVYLVEVKGSLFFGNAGPLQRKLTGLKDVESAVIDMKNVPYIDQSGAYALADLMKILNEHETRVYIAGLQSEPSDLMRRLNFLPELCREDRIFSEVSAAIECAARDAHNRIETRP